MHGQDALFDTGVWPHDIQQFALADQKARLTNQSNEDILCFRCEGDDLLGLQEAALVHVESKLAEPVDLVTPHAV